MGGAPDAPGGATGSDAGGSSGGGGSSDAGAGGDGGSSGSGADSGSSGASGGAGTGGAASSDAVDGSGNSLGYPKDTPVAQMTDRQQAAYWKHNSRRHESRVKDLVGDRTPDAVKADLDAYAKIQRDQQTPAEQALNDKYAEGQRAGVTAERRSAATAIFRGALEAGGMTGDDVDELATSFNVDGFITDAGVDTTKITNFAKRFQSDKDTRRVRDFGAGSRDTGGAPSTPGSRGKAEAQRRFGKHTTNGE
ncbi:MAG: hypothetical protein CMH83_07175 [Nocardioides sp.]|nr:hypothetical protein [Nocardioides sp.]